MPGDFPCQSEAAFQLLKEKKELCCVVDARTQKGTDEQRVLQVGCKVYSVVQVWKGAFSTVIISVNKEENVIRIQLSSGSCMVERDGVKIFIILSSVSQNDNCSILNAAATTLTLRSLPICVGYISANRLPS